MKTKKLRFSQETSFFFPYRNFWGGKGSIPYIVKFITCEAFFFACGTRVLGHAGFYGRKKAAEARRPPGCVRRRAAGRHVAEGKRLLRARGKPAGKTGAADKAEKRRAKSTRKSREHGAADKARSRGRRKLGLCPGCGITTPGRAGQTPRISLPRARKIFCTGKTRRLEAPHGRLRPGPGDWPRRPPGCVRRRAAGRHVAEGKRLLRARGKPAGKTGAADKAEKRRAKSTRKSREHGAADKARSRERRKLGLCPGCGITTLGRAGQTPRISLPRARGKFPARPFFP